MRKRIILLTTLLAGCGSRPGVDINGNANVNLTRPVPLSIEQPINVQIEGLVVPYEGTYVAPEVFEQVHENDSTEYVAAVLGKPDFETRLGDGTIVWRWKYRPTAQQASVFSLFGSGKKDEPSPEHVTAIVIFKGEKVLRRWRGT